MEEEEEERGGIPHSDGRTEGEEEEKSRSGHGGVKGKGDLGGKYPRRRRREDEQRTFLGGGAAVRWAVVLPRLTGAHSDPWWWVFQFQTPPPSVRRIGGRGGNKAPLSSFIPRCRGSLPADQEEDVTPDFLRPSSHALSLPCGGAAGEIWRKASSGYEMGRERG